jgi:glutamate carboxypeptidase
MHTLLSRTWGWACSAALPATLSATLSTTLWASALFASAAHAQNTEPATVQAQATAQVQPLLSTLKDLVAIESGSRDLEGLQQLAEHIGQRLQAAGMTVQTLPTKAPDFHPQLKGAKLGSMVYGTKAGKGQRKVLLIAHMDTVYPRGMGVKQPFRIDGNRAYGLGISDDKGGVALILHTVKLLADMGFDDYAQLGVLINGDEEIGSAGSSAFITQLGGEYDAVMSFEGGGGAQLDHVRLATSSIAIVEMKIKGKASHAGAAPELGRNALYELAHQMLKSRGFGDDPKGLKINWTVAQAGGSRNVIPAEASAIADVRSLSNEDMDRLEARLNESIKDKLIPDTQIELSFYRSRPAFAANAVSRTLAQHAKGIYSEMGLTLSVSERASGGGTDAAFAGLRPKGGVLESFGLRGFGGHSNDDEYILIDSIAPRLYLATRMVMDVGRGVVKW